MVKIDIAKDYTKQPGGRYISEGLFSGEDFRNKILKPKFEEAMEHNENLIVNLDGGYGYGSSFLEESFGGLVRETKNNKVAEIKIISDEEPKLVEDVAQYIRDAISKLGGK